MSSIPSPQFNCQQATLLIERGADERLPALTRAQLWAHLALCPLCRRYEAQSQFLAHHARPVAENPRVALSEAARVRLQTALDQHSGPAGADGPATPIQEK